MDFEKFADILEYVPTQSKIINIEHKLIKEVQSFITQYNNDIYAVSLSGGVDSMVLTNILHFLGKKVVCIHINYNNRGETIKEEEFIKLWCDSLNIKIIIHNIDNMRRGKIKRADYETMTKDVRFNLYKDVLKEYGCSEILLGHHKDDIIENIFNNISRGRNILDLAVLKTTSVIKNINVTRPLLNVHKDIIFDYAHICEIPYFKDTTPDWSLRGTFRNKILPLLTSTYPNISNNLLNISQQSDEWNSLIEEKIINPFMESVKYNYKSVEMNIKDNIKSPGCFWKNIFMKIFYQYGCSIPTRKSINCFIEFINSDKINKFTKIDKANVNLTNNCSATLDSEFKLILYFNL